MQTAAAYQPQPPYQQQPMPLPPKKSSLTWLWVTLGAVGLVVIAGLGLLFALGGEEETDPITPANAPVAAVSADKALVSYLEARKAGDTATAYSLLSAKSREAYTQAEYTTYYQQAKITGYGAVEVVKAQDPWYQVVARNYATGTKTYAAAPFTVVKEGGKFLVALENPLNERMDQAFADQRYADALKLADQMLAINPNSYYGYYNRGWALLESGQFQPAITAFTEAGKFVIAEDKPDLVRSLGNAYLNLKQWDQAVAQLTEARGWGQAYGNLYSASWFQQVDADLAIAYEQQGQIAKAIDLLESNYKADPNSTLARSAAIRLERKPYKTENGISTYKLILQGVTFGLPQDWVVSSETTGGDWWFARHPASPQGRSDFAVYFHGDYLGKTLDEAVAGILKRYQEPIGSPKRDVTITQRGAVTLSGKQGVALEFSDGTFSVLVPGAVQQWIDFHWFANAEAMKAFEQWAPTVQFTR